MQQAAVTSSSIMREDLSAIFNSLTQEQRARLHGSRIVITGCAGFLGFYLVNFLVLYAEKLGIEKVVGLDSFIVGEPDWLKRLAANSVFSSHRFDIAADDLQRIPALRDATHVLHMASIASPTFYRRYPLQTLDANVWGLRRLLNYYNHSSLRGLLFFSSSEVYGDPSSEFIPTPEDYPGNTNFVGPRACYDEAKRFGETLCYLYAKEHALPITVVRPFNNFGPGMKENDRRVPADFARAVLEGQDIIIHSNGSPTRTFCYITDALSGYLKALLHGRYDVFNIGAQGPEISVQTLAEIYRSKAQGLFGYSGTIRFERSNDGEYMTHNPNRRCPCLAHAQEILGYGARIDVSTGVERYLRFLRESKEAR
ncbi:MAG: NAD-dependent epimerase/dehydratase family protein [Oligoflexia bacterium]|nr:NAD-dependent epimerase/dehydratase family protein [Oligoflexia bacterium]